MLTLILVILIVSYLFEELLDYLNLRAHHRELPQAVQGLYDAETYARSYDYHRANYRFSLLKGLLSFLITFAVLASGGLGWLDHELRSVTTHPVGLPLLFFAVIFFASDLLSLPFQLYHTFVIEERFGFNRMTWRTFVADKLKGYVLGALLGGILLGALLLLIDKLGQNFWIWFWGVFAVFTLFVTFFYTSLFLPLFNKLSPLEEGELRSAILAFGRKVGFPLDQVLVMDGSRRSSKANAFFSGLGKRKRVVLYDTLIGKHGEEELVAVLAHEIGHYKKKHIPQGFVLSLLQTGVLLFILSRFVQSPELSQALGGTETAIHLNLIAFGLLFSPISTLLGIGANVFSRKNEYEADRYAAENYAAQPLADALLKLHKDNLSNLTPHPWYVFFHYSHPPLLQRLKALKSLSL